MTSRRLLAGACVALPFATGIGCSLVNSFGDVLPASGDSGVDSSDDQTSPGFDSGGDTGATHDAMQEASADSQTLSDAGPTQDSTVTDSASMDSGPGAPVGAIVVGGNQSGDGGFVLSVLDPTSGTELSREAMTVVGVHYDGLRDEWYIFENNGGLGGIFPAPTDPVKLHVRMLDTHTGVWTEQSTTPVPVLESTDNVAVLNQRLAYVAYALTDAGTPTGGVELVLVDTSNPAAPVTVGAPTPLSSYPTGTIGTRNAGGIGGTLNLFHVDTTQCQGGGDAGPQVCELVAVHADVLSSGAPTLFAQVAVAAVNSQNAEGFGSYITGGPEDVIAFPPLGAASGYVQRFLTSTSVAVSGSQVSFATGDPHLQTLAISECHSTAFVVGIPLDTQVYGVPLTGATSTVVTADLGHAGQGVVYEPFTDSVLAPFKASGSFSLDAYLLGGTASSPTLTSRVSAGTWSPPADLEPNFVAVRQPIPITCPP